MALGLALALAGCAKAPVSRTDSDGDTHYPLTGRVVSVDAAHDRVTVAHDAVPGLMAAMTMEFPAAPGDIATVHPGERIRADLVKDKEGRGRLEKIWPDDQSGTDAVAEGARRLREDTHDRGDGVYRDLGESIPGFTLWDQDGRVVQSGRFQGKQIMLNFIYTHCPFANMCPLSTHKMIEAQQLAKKAGVKDIEFVSFTLDPANDTPGVLHDYAASRNIDTSNFTFLTGPAPAIRDLLTQFGVIADFEGGVLKHTLATLLVDEKGRIVWRADGSEWNPQDFVARMRK
ncbi:MAG TPA: SCO family protein [Opitutaceae bacterium]|nr:SCO family protein [Opitutaceae bacterium]